jgi:HK97 family phage portal protein
MPLVPRLARPKLRQAAPAGTPSYGMIPPLGSVPSASGQLISQATAMTVSAVYRAISVRAHDIASCEPSVFSTGPDGTPQKLGADDHYLAELMEKPNRVQTWFEFMRDTWVAYLLRGNAYWVVLRDRRGQPQELIWVNPDAVIVLEAADGSWFYSTNRIGLFQIAMLADFPPAIPAEHVVHFRGISFNMLVAASTIGLARDSIGTAMGLGQQQSRWIGNGARPSVILETDLQLTKASAERLKDSWNAYQAGLQNTGGTAVLEEGIKARPLQLTSVDLQFIDQCQLSVQDVARFFGVPTRKLMQPDIARGSTIIQEDQSYINETVRPDGVLIEQKLEDYFGLRKGKPENRLGVFLDSTPLLRADPLTRANLGRITTLSGLTAPNEWRRSERLPPVPGGDTVRAPVNLAALGSDTTGTAPDAAGRPPKGQEPAPAVATGAHRPGSQRLGLEEDDWAGVPFEGGVRYSDDQPRDENGRWAAGDGELRRSATPATDLFERETDHSATVESVMAKLGPEAQERVDATDRRLEGVVPTSTPVSEGGFKNPDGTWTEERQALHDDIAGRILNDEAVARATPALGEKPTFTMLGGRGGSGKSWLSGKDGPVDRSKTLVLDNDEIKSKLPEYQGWNAGQLHEEASDIFNRVDAMARAAGLNVAHEATMKTAGNAAKFVKAYQDAGYRTEGYYMFVPPEVATERAVGRFMGDGGRYVPPAYVMASRSNEASFDAIKGGFDKWAVYNNNVAKGLPPVLVAKGGRED